jgi:nitroreductase
VNRHSAWYALPVRAVVARIRDILKIYTEALIDARRHAQYSAATRNASRYNRTPRQQECQITKDYHRIEKGLALRQPKRPFGSEAQQRLLGNLERYESTGTSGPLTTIARGAIESLEYWNTTGSITGAAVRTVTRDDPPLTRDLAERFFGGRSSVRDFDETLVQPDAIRDAVRLALNSPSVCNRQAWRVDSYHSQPLIGNILALQNGNRGFTDQIPCVLVVSVDLQLFSGSAERNQRWIDGGLFAMSLVWALHSAGIASCMLNWSMSNRATKRLRSVAGLPAHYDVITLIAVGYAPSQYRVARSPRRDPGDVLTVHGDALSPSPGDSVTTRGT